MARDEMGLEAELLLKKAGKSDQMALSRLLSLVEKDLRGAAPFSQNLKPEVKLCGLVSRAHLVRVKVL